MNARPCKPGGFTRFISTAHLLLLLLFLLTGTQDSHGRGRGRPVPVSGRARAVSRIRGLHIRRISSSAHGTASAQGPTLRPPQRHRPTPAIASGNLCTEPRPRQPPGPPCPHRRRCHREHMLPRDPHGDVFVTHRRLCAASEPTCIPVYGTAPLSTHFHGKPWISPGPARSPDTLYSTNSLPQPPEEFLLKQPCASQHRRTISIGKDL